MPTPYQPKTAVETPFGPATINDHRDYDTPRHALDGSWYSKTTRAAIGMDGAKINNKEYPMLTLYVESRGDGSLSIGPLSYGTLTPAAAEKLEAWWKSEDGLKALAPFLDHLDDASRRSSLKHKLFYPLQRTIREVCPNPYSPPVDNDLRVELLDEIIEDIAKARANGIHFYKIED
jgi:hypothetical protein